VKVLMVIIMIVIPLLCGCNTPDIPKDNHDQSIIVDHFIHAIFTKCPKEVAEQAQGISTEVKRGASKRLWDLYGKLTYTERHDCIQALWILNNDDSNETLASILKIERDPELTCNAVNILIERGKDEAYDYYIRALSVKTTKSNYENKMAWLSCLSWLLQEGHIFNKKLIPVIIGNITADSKASVYFASQCATMMQSITNTLPDNINETIDQEYELQESPQKIKEVHDKWARWWEENKDTFKYQYQPWPKEQGGIAMPSPAQ